MYRPEERERLREELLAAARADERITGAAITGSAAAGVVDGWSDIDLAFGIADPARLQEALTSWTDVMYQQHGAVHHVDVLFGTWVYRVFLLQSTLQVDLAFAPAADFGARSSTFRLQFGTSADLPHTPPPSAASLIGIGWLHALHARSCIERGQPWRAEYMISTVRDHALALASLRRGLPPSQGRGMDQLPASVTAPLEEALVRSLDTNELRRAFGAATKGLLVEIRQHDPALAERLEGPLKELTGSSPLPA